MQVGIRDVLEGNLVWTVEVVLCSMAASWSSAQGLRLGVRSEPVRLRVQMTKSGGRKTVAYFKVANH